MSNANRQKSEAAAKPVIDAIKAKFNVAVDTRWTDDGLVVSYKVVSGSDGDNPYVMSPQNLSKVIDPFFRQYRDKGWTFTQPAGGKFTIAVLEGMNELRRLSQLAALYESDPDLSPDQMRGIEHEISDRLKTDVEVGRVTKSGDVYTAYYTHFDKDENEVEGSMKFKVDFDDWKIENFEVITEAGRVFQVGDRPAPRTGPADHEKARAFDKPGTNRSVLFHAGKGKWVGVEYATEENEDGEEEIQILMMRDDIEPYAGKHPYYGINVAFKRDGTVFGFAAQGDPIASKQWSREKHAIIAAAKKALDDPTLPGMYDGLGGMSVKRGKGKLPFDVTDHRLVEGETVANTGKITFKQFMLGEAAPKPFKVKEPGWYVVDHMDKAVEGPMQEGAAHRLADEMNAGATGGDIPPYDVTYFSDYDIRRANEALTLVVDNTKKKSKNRLPDTIKAGDKFQATDADDKPTGVVLTAKSDATTSPNGRVKIETDKGVKSFDDMDFVTMVTEDIEDMAWAEEMAKTARFKGKVDLKSTTTVPYSEADLMITRLKTAKHKVKSSRPKVVISHMDVPNKGMSFDFTSGDEGMALVKFWK